MFPYSIKKRAKKVVELLKENGRTITFAESCTGGLLAAAITEIAGSSAVIKGFYGTYCNKSKQTMVNVSKNNLDQYGAVSYVVAGEMAKGAYEKSSVEFDCSADIAVSVTGFAGPGKDQDNQEVGDVFIGIYQQKHDTLQIKAYNFKGSRSKVRKQATIKALDTIKKALIP